MKVLRITGATGTGKTVALKALQKQFGGAFVLAERNQARATRALIKDTTAKRVYIDIDGRPTPALEAYILKTLAANGVEWLAMAHA